MDISSAVYIFLEDRKRIDKFGPEDGHPAMAGLNILHFLQERGPAPDIHFFCKHSQEWFLFLKGSHFFVNFAFLSTKSYGKSY